MHMNFESLLLTPDNDEKKTDSKVASKLVKAGQAALAAGVLLSGAGCKPDHQDTSSKVSDADFVSGIKQTVDSLDKINKMDEQKKDSFLPAYYQHMKEEVFPSDSMAKESLARAREIIRNKGFHIGNGQKIEVKVQGHVPVEIKVDGQFVPVGASDYTPEELTVVRLSQDISHAMKVDQTKIDLEPKQSAVGSSSPKNAPDSETTPGPFVSHPDDF